MKTLQTLFRYFIGAAFAIAFSFTTISLLTTLTNAVWGFVPESAFWIIIIIGLILCAFYASIIGRLLLDIKAILLGSLIGLIIAAIQTRVDVVPYAVLGSLVLAAISASVLGTLFRPTDTFRRLPALISAIHMVTTLIVAVAVVYSLWTPWLRPFVSALVITGFTMWSPLLFSACPLTLFEARIRNKVGEQTQIEEEGFVRYHLQKILRLKFSRQTYNRSLRIIAGVYFLWILIDYVAIRHS